MAAPKKEDEVLANLYARARELLDEDKCEDAGALILMLVEKKYPPAMVTRAAFLEREGGHQESMELLRGAAEQGHPEAMALLGCKLYRGDTSEEETQEGREWICKAAEEADEIARRMADFLVFAGDEPSPLSTLAPDGAPLVQLAKGVLNEHVLGDMSAAKRHYSHPDLLRVTDDHLQQLKMRCQYCKRESDRKLKECKGCKGPRYCSIVCQTEHWPQHKKVCQRNE